MFNVTFAIGIAPSLQPSRLSSVTSSRTGKNVARNSWSGLHGFWSALANLHACSCPRHCDRTLEHRRMGDGVDEGPDSQPQRFPDKHSRLAFYINAYNALAMYGVVQAGVPESLSGLTKLTFFYLRTFTVGGKSISLSKFENDVIRPLGDERVHFALNCVVVSCPRLPRVAFSAAVLDGQLDTAARSFIGDTRNVWIEHAKREVWL